MDRTSQENENRMEEVANILLAGIFRVLAGRTTDRIKNSDRTSTSLESLAMLVAADTEQVGH